MLAAALLLTTTWLTGPPPDGQLEFYLSGAYAEAPEAQHDSTLGWQRTMLMGGFAHSIDPRHTLRFEMPYIHVQSDLNGELFYANGGIGRAYFSGERWLTKKTQLRVSIAVPMGQSYRAAKEQFPVSGASLPPINDGSSHSTVYLAHIHSQKSWKFGARVHLDADLDDGGLTPGLLGLAMYQVIPNALQTGFLMEAQFGLERESEKEVSIGILEQIGPPRGFAGEVQLSTTVHAHNTETATQALVRLVWRQ